MNTENTQLSYYFASDERSGAEIKGILPDKQALDELVKFIKTHNKPYIDCGIIWVDQVAVNNLDTGNVSIEYEKGEWAVWCNYEGKPITQENMDINGNWGYAVNVIRRVILS